MKSKSDALYTDMIAAMDKWVTIKKSGGKSDSALNRLRIARWRWIKAKGRPR